MSIPSLRANSAFPAPSQPRSASKADRETTETPDRVTIDDFRQMGASVTGEAIVPISASLGLPALAAVLISPGAGLLVAGAAAVFSGLGMGGMKATGTTDGEGFAFGAVLGGGAAGLGLMAATVAGLPGVVLATTLAAGLGLYIEKNA